MARPVPGEVWMIDLGLAAKVRPCLILSDYPGPEELALIVSNRWEFSLPKPFLKPGAFHLQQVQPVSLPRLERRLGVLTADCAGRRSRRAAPDAARNGTVPRNRRRPRSRNLSRLFRLGHLPARFRAGGAGRRVSETPSTQCPADARLADDRLAPHRRQG